MMLRLIATALLAWVISAVPAHAATIFTFSIAGTTDFDTESVLSYSFSPSGTGGTLTFTKDLDATSLDILEAATQGTTFAAATFTAYDTVVSAETELYSYLLTGVTFTSVTLDQLTETVVLIAQGATLATPSGATAFSFSVDGTTAFDTDAIHWFSFVPSGSGGTLRFNKEIDATSDDLALAVASGSLFTGATFIGYDGVVSPQTELFRYILTNIFFTSVTLDGLGPTQTVTVLAEGARFQEGPAAVPEPATGLMLLAGAAALAARFRRGA